MAIEDRVNTPRIAVFGVLSAVGLFGILVGLQAMYLNMSDAEQNRKDVRSGPNALADQLAVQQTQLHSYHWVDEKKGIVAVPIDRAMDLVVNELRDAQATSMGESANAP
jgi:hypothetical protein